MVSAVSQTKSIPARCMKATGFTLIELLVTIAVVGVLLAFAVPSFTQMLANSRVRGTAQSLQSALLKTRSEALKRNATVTLRRKSGGWDAGWEVVDETVDPDVVLDSGMPSSRVTMTEANSLSQVSYARSGRLVPGSTAMSMRIVDVGNKGTPRCVRVVDMSGRTEVKEC